MQSWLFQTKSQKITSAFQIHKQKLIFFQIIGRVDTFGHTYVSLVLRICLVETFKCLLRMSVFI